MKQRNGKIDFFRFVFSMVVILFHLNYVYYEGKLQLTGTFNFFAHGCIGVEFFFLVTGWLFANACHKLQDRPAVLGKETVQYVAHKWYAVFPSHLVAFAATFITTVYFARLNAAGIITRFARALPNFLLVQQIGIYSADIIGEEWYISVMLLVLNLVNF